MKLLASMVGDACCSSPSSKLFIKLDHDVEATQLLQRVECTCHFPVHSRIPYFLGRTYTKENIWEVWNYATPPGTGWNKRFGFGSPEQDRQLGVVVC